jgi:hypothetical protein
MHPVRESKSPHSHDRYRIAELILAREDAGSPISRG